MRTDGIDLVEGSDINNPVIEKGSVLPGIAENGQLYYLTVGNVGLHVFDQGQWTILGDSGSLATHITNGNLHLSTAQDALLDGITVDSTEINHMTGATSNIQAQLDSVIGTVAGEEGNLVSFDASSNLQDAGYSAAELKAGRKNKIINGRFDFWQRGTSFTDEGYTADRWRISFSDGFTADGAIDIEHFEMGGDHYVSIATEEGSNSGIGSRIYKFNIGTGTYEFFQTVIVAFGHSSKYFEISGERYILYTVVVSDGSHVTNSKLFKFSIPNNQFEFYQDIPSQGAGGCDFVTIGGNHYLMIANQSNGTTNNIDSFLYKWNFGTELFDLHQNIFAFGAQSVTFFEMLGNFYLAVSEPSNFPTTNIVEQRIYKYNSGTDQFDLFQTMPPIIGGLDWEYFEVSGEHFLIAAEHGNGNTINNSSRCFRFNVGADEFQLHQTVATTGASDWEHFIISGEHYLACAYSQSGPGFGSFNEFNSEIFKFNTTTQLLEIHSLIPTAMIQDWGHVEISGEHYLIPANRFANGSFIADCPLYKWNFGTELFEEQSVVNPLMERKVAGGASPIISKYFVDLTSDISTGAIGIEQRIEDVLQFNGETLTLSFYARCDVNSTLIVNLNRVGIQGEVEPSDISLSQSVAVTPTWEHHSFTFEWTHLTNSIDLLNYLSVSFVSDASITSSTFLADIQLEEGSIATDVEYRHPSTELELCQRYYNKSYNIETVEGTITDEGAIDHKVIAGSALPTTISQTINLPNAMRIQPSLTVYSNVTGSQGVVNVNGTDIALDSIVGGDSTYKITVTNPSGNTNRQVQFHYVADAEI